MTVLELAVRLLLQDEPEAGAVIVQVFADEEIDVRLGATVNAVEERGMRGDARIRVETDVVLKALDVETRLGSCCSERAQR